MLASFVVAGIMVSVALALAALGVIRPSERVVGFLFFAFFLLIVLGLAWAFMLMLGSG